MGLYLIFENMLSEKGYNIVLLFYPVKKNIYTHVVIFTYTGNVCGQYVVLLQWNFKVIIFLSSCLLIFLYLCGMCIRRDESIFIVTQ